MLRPPLHGLTSGKVPPAGFAGRRSGRRYATPVGYARVGLRPRAEAVTDEGEAAGVLGGVLRH